MMKLIIPILIMLMIVAIVKGETEWCYQETANDSSVTSTTPTASDGDCGVYNGNYDRTGTWTDYKNTYDGDWGALFGISANLGEISYLYINYTKPSNALSTSLWQVRTTAPLLTISNLSISANCWDESQLQFRVSSYSAFASSTVNWTCWDGTEWEVLNSALGIANVYEEAMWWDIETPAVPPTIFIRHNNKVIQIPYTFFERYNNDAWVINVDKIMFKRFVRWIS